MQRYLQAIATPAMVMGLSLALANSSSGQTYSIDPNLGTDTTTGQPNGPFKTLHFAVDIANANFAAAPVFRLEPGTYSVATNGEDFPILLPPNSVVEGVTRRGVILEHRFQGAPPFGLSSYALRCVLDGESSETCTIRDIRIKGNQRGLEIRATDSPEGTTPQHQVLLERVRTNMNTAAGLPGSPTFSGFGIALRADRGRANVQVLACQTRDFQTGIDIIARDGADMQAEISGCRLRNHPSVTLLSSGIGLGATAFQGFEEAPATLDLKLANSSWHRLSNGFVAAGADSSTIDATVDHCAFSNCGNLSGAGGAILPLSGTTLGITNSIFFGNGSDVPTGSASANVSVAACLVESSSDLLAIEPSLPVGDPQWVDQAGADFHLLPSSPCLDAGVFGTGLQLDRDGDSRTNACAGTPDIGVDELLEADAYLPAGNVVKLGQTVTVRFYGPSASVAAFVVGNPATGAPCTGPLLDTSAGAPIYPLIPNGGVAVILPGTSGSGPSTTTGTFVVPNAPALVGTSFNASSVYVRPNGTVVYGQTLREIRIE